MDRVRTQAARFMVACIVMRMSFQEARELAEKVGKARSHLWTMVGLLGPVFRAVDFDPYKISRRDLVRSMKHNLFEETRSHVKASALSLPPEEGEAKARTKLNYLLQELGEEAPWVEEVYLSVRRIYDSNPDLLKEIGVGIKRRG